MTQTYCTLLFAMLSLVSSLPSSVSYPAPKRSSVQSVEENQKSPFRKSGPELRQIDGNERLSSQNVLCSEDGPNEYPNENPKKYIYCVKSGRWFYLVFTCPEGSFYDPQRRACNFYSMENACDTRKRELSETGEDATGIICP